MKGGDIGEELLGGPELLSPGCVPHMGSPPPPALAGPGQGPSDPVHVAAQPICSCRDLEIGVTTLTSQGRCGDSCLNAGGLRPRARAQPARTGAPLTSSQGPVRCRGPETGGLAPHPQAEPTATAVSSPGDSWGAGLSDPCSLLSSPIQNLPHVQQHKLAQVWEHGAQLGDSPPSREGGEGP